MTEKSLDEMVNASVKDVLERMTFMELEPQIPFESEAFRLSGSMAVSIGFAGEFRGMLIISCPDSFAREAAANLLGEDEGDITDYQVIDNMKELANMTAGGIFNRLNPDRSVARLSIPEYHDLNGEPFPYPPPSRVRVFPYEFSSMSSETGKPETLFFELAMQPSGKTQNK